MYKLIKSNNISVYSNSYYNVYKHFTLMTLQQLFDDWFDCNGNRKWFEDMMHKYVVINICLFWNEMIPNLKACIV